ncbi:MAG: hypothetical protein ACOVS5_11815, partial [Oligoflexus sp.]
RYGRISRVKLGLNSKKTTFDSERIVNDFSEESANELQYSTGMSLSLYFTGDSMNQRYTSIGSFKPVVSRHGTRKPNIRSAHG